MLVLNQRTLYWLDRNSDNSTSQRRRDQASRCESHRRRCDLSHLSDHLRIYLRQWQFCFLWALVYRRYSVSRYHRRRRRKTFLEVVEIFPNQNRHLSSN